MEKIKFYLTLKAGEVWTEVKNSLAASGVEATSTDAELIENGIAANIEHVVTLRDLQQARLTVELKDQTKNLVDTYDDIAFRHYAEEATAARHTETVDRISRHPRLLVARQRQREQLAVSRERCDPVTDAHAAHHESEGLPDGFNGTVFPSQLLLSGLLQPGADGTAADDAARHGTIKTTRMSEIEAV